MKRKPRVRSALQKMSGSSFDIRRQMRAVFLGSGEHRLGIPTSRSQSRNNALNFGVCLGQCICSRGNKDKQQHSECFKIQYYINIKQGPHIPL